jgi:hypothetical protein
MTISLALATANAAGDTVADRVDLGSTNPTGRLIVKTAADAVLATIPLLNPAFAAFASRTAALLGVPLSATATGTGTAAKFDVVDRNAAVVFSGSVGVAGSGADAIIDLAAITTGDTVRVTSLSLVSPP